MPWGARVWRFVGGPQHGLVIPDEDVSGDKPVVLTGQGQAENFLDTIVGGLRWVEGVAWYERSMANE